MVQEDAGAKVKKVCEGLLGVGTHASMLDGSPTPEDWRQRFEPITPVIQLGGAGKGRLRRWLWSYRTEPWFGVEGTFAWVIRGSGKCVAGFGRLK